MGVEAVSRAFRACFWAGLSGIGVFVAESCSVVVFSGSETRILLFLPKPWGRKSLAERGRGVR